MIYASRGRNGGCELSYRCGDGPVEDGNDQKFVENTRRATIEDGDQDGAANGRPNIADDETNTGEGKEGKVAMEFLGVTRCVDDNSVFGRALSRTGRRLVRTRLFNLCHFFYRRQTNVLGRRRMEDKDREQ